MSNNPQPATQSTRNTYFQAWHQFVRQNASQQSESKFPRSQLLTFSQSNKCPKVKQLLLYLPSIYKAYQLKCQNFNQLIILLYLLLLKGCGATNPELLQKCLSILEQLLKFRIAVLCMSNKSNNIIQVYNYMKEWLSLLVPVILMATSMGISKSFRNKQATLTRLEEREEEEKTFVSILETINRKQKIDYLIVIFEGLLISKIRNHLTFSSLFQFDSLLRRIYSQEKYQLIYQGRGSFFHMGNKQKEEAEREKDFRSSSTIQISKIVPLRLSDTSFEVCDLEILWTQKQQNKRQENKCLLLKKAISEKPTEDWVVDAYKVKNPNKIKISFDSLIKKMRAIEQYRFLCLLQIYGSSPNIEVLNEYIPDQRMIQLFTKFLLGENLVEYAIQIKGSKCIQYLKKYSYRNQRMIKVLQYCLNEAVKLQASKDIDIFMKEFKIRVKELKDRQNKKVQNRRQVHPFQQ